MPRLARWFFRNVPSEGISQYIFVLVIVFATGFLAEVAGLEAIIGAFLAGLVLNRLIPHTSPLMNRIDFVGNAIFIPFFLISVGMLVDLRVLLQGLEAWIVAGTMIFVAISSKWLAAFITQKIFNFSSIERNVIFGLSTARAAATLTAVLIGYDLGILNENVLNGTILMILVTCVISSFVVEKAGRKLGIEEGKISSSIDIISNRILVPISNPATIEPLIDFAVLIKDPHSSEPIYPLAVVKEAEDTKEKLVATYKMLQKAIYHASATENRVQLVLRIDMNIAGGILRAIRELLITEVVIGWNGKITTRERIFGTVLDNLLSQSQQLILVCKIIHPLNTVKNVVVVIPPNAEQENGFLRWVNNVRTISKQIGANIKILGNQRTNDCLQSILEESKPALTVTYHIFQDWEKFLQLNKEVTENDLLIIVSARYGAISHSSYLDKVPGQLARYFEAISFVIIYPNQDSMDEESNSLGAIEAQKPYFEKVND